MKKIGLYNYKVEAVWCIVYSLEMKVVVGSIFIPPNDVSSLKCLFNVLEKLMTESLSINLTGDFNAPHPYWLDRDANNLDIYFLIF